MEGTTVRFNLDGVAYELTGKGVDADAIVESAHVTATRPATKWHDARLDFEGRATEQLGRTRAGKILLQLVAEAIDAA